MSRAEIRTLLRERLGLDPESIGPSTLEHAIGEAMRRLGSVSPGELYARLQRDATAWQTLVEEVTVPETWFFRVPEQYTELAAFARARAGKDVFRVLSLPCSTGEEAWSAALALADAGVPTAAFEVVGIDVNASAVAAARRARYRRVAFRGSAPPLAHGEEIDGEWRPSVRLARSVTFRIGNALDPTVLAAGDRFDAVFCRNLLIYLDPAARKRVLDRVDAVLATDGLVFAGQAEALPALDPRWQAAEGLGPLTFRRSVPIEPARALGTPPPPMAPRSPERPKQSPRRDPPARPSGLAEARRLADRGDLAAAQSLLDAWLAGQPEDAAAWRLLGTVRLARDELAAADEALARAGYLARGDDESLRLRVLIAERRGETDVAARLRARLARSEGSSR